MPLKSTDMAKNMAKKLNSSLKSENLPDRFGKVSGGVKRERAAAISASKLVAVNYRLPADLVNRLRDCALNHAGGLNALLTTALSEWLDSQKK